LILGLPLSFVLGLPPDIVPPDLRTLAGLGGLLAAGGLFLHARRLWPALPRWRSPLVFLALTAGMLAAAAIKPLALWAEAAGLRILYLHGLLLGFITLGLLAAWAEQAGRRPAGIRWLTVAAAALLCSLLPLTGLWPAQLAGGWRLAVAFVFSLGPPLAAAGWWAAFNAREAGRS